MKILMPSPNGTNHEQLYMSPLRGAAYDARGGLLGYDRRLARDAAQDPVAVLQKWVIENLDDDAQNRLIEILASKPWRPAQDDEASLDPNATRFGPNGTVKRKAQLNAGDSAMDSARRRQIAMDAKWASALKGAFARPGTAAYDQRERRKLAADAATISSLAERFPDVAKIVVHPEAVDRNAVRIGLRRMERSTSGPTPFMARLSTRFN